ncbi:inositol monophosphatase family protein [Aeromicrobium duanguangcaii]|uniref:Inositol monophosphatase family protein n=1 Tax=Aeromicrobium duanguangcaii TaxID=2968086 RepID=A0ABY5KJF3_9ACTN|nr:inositol monophosphatase family protein [Aeromicrobium duanguangcaii]MCD9154459.1 inositol monophosphatase family protein [Aeromicrobium duanguangcaii]UUI68483.1 inositol monophosphatase family protein [Aeromicrobium duanguangcaii]
MNVTPDDVTLATELVVEAAALAARIRAEDDLQTRSKTSVSDIVTAADYAAEARIVEHLDRERPEDGLLGEEGTSREGTSGRRWVIDPVDGTYNFASGFDYWCSAIALADGDRPLLGAVAHHATGTVVVGGPGVPTTINGRPVSPIEDAAVSQLGVATYAHPAFIVDHPGFAAWRRAAALPATIRMLGSGSMDLVGVATGRLGCWFQHSTPDWDWLPGTALVLGAGGVTERVEVDGLVWSVAGPPTGVGQIVDALQGDAA